MSANERPVSRSAKALSIFLALLPPARMAWIVFAHGENNLSNDYEMRVPLVISMIDGTCSLAKYLREAWIVGGHSLIALTPIYYMNAKFFAWDARVELALGLLIAGATLALIAATLRARARWMLLPLLSLLHFSTTKVSSFTFGESTLQMGLSQLGVALGVCALARWPGRPLALPMALAFGGLLASWSWGGGIVVWLLFGGALALKGARSVWLWVILLVGATLGLAQYAWLLPSQISSTTAGPAAWATKGRLFLDLLGRPLVNGTANAEPDLLSQALGATGLALLAVTLIFLRKEFRANLPAILCVSWAVLVALQIGFARAAVAPWYASPMAFFWAGLLLLLSATPAAIRAAGVFLIAVLALRVQGTWEDKSFYLPSRAPVSAACLREWRTNAVACHDRLFQWGGIYLNEAAALGEPLERHGLSVFGPRRTYLLQGDAAVGRVGFEPESSRAFFSADNSTHGDIDDFRRLDLVLSPGAAVTWRVDLPPGTRLATFSTVVRAVPGDAQLARGVRVSVTTEGSPSFLEERAFLPRDTARPLSVDLSSLAGRRVTLRLFGEETHEGATPLVFEAPKIELRVDG